MSWGGKREGAGRKPQSGEIRKNCSLKATAAEWELIKTFAGHVKHGDKEKCEALLKLLVESD